MLQTIKLAPCRQASYIHRAGLGSLLLLPGTDRHLSGRNVTGTAINERVYVYSRIKLQFCIRTRHSDGATSPDCKYVEDRENTTSSAKRARSRRRIHREGGICGGGLENSRS